MLLFISQFFFNNIPYLIIGSVVFGVLIYRLQQPYKPSVFTIIFLYHFVQVSAWIWMADYLGEDVNYRSPLSGTAVLMGYICLIALFIPIIYFHNKIPEISLNTLKKHAGRLSIKKTFIAYIIAFFSLNALGAAAFRFAGLSQLIFSLVNVKWFFYLLLGFQVAIKRKMFRPFLFFTVLEFTFGFFSYFSDFKTVVFYLACLSLTFLVKVSLKQLTYGLLTLAAAFVIGVTWTAIKGEYRVFLNQGSRTQSVQVSKSQALDKLTDLVENNDDTTAGVSFLYRLQYTWHLAKSMEHVPAVVPYQNGSNWGETLLFALTPRFLNPDKPIYQASLKATKYTGIPYLSTKSGVSFSLGYFADGYVDFGYFGMFIPLLIIGFIYGAVYWYFIRKSSNNFIFNYAVVGAFFMEFFAMEMDSTYLAGRLFNDIVMFTLLRFLFFPWLVKNLKEYKMPIEKKMAVRKFRFR